MKSKFLTQALILASLGSFAQNANVVSAFNYLRYYEKDKSVENIKNAKTAIDEAINHPESKDKAKTWHYRTNIYISIMQAKNEEVKNLAPNAIDEAFTSALKTIEYERPIKESRREYTVPSNEYINGIFMPTYINSGAELFQQKQYERAYKNFEKAIEAINYIDTAIIAKNPKIDPKVKDEMVNIKASAINNAALAAETGNMYKEAEKYYRIMVDTKMGGADTYAYFANFYRKNGKEKEAVDIVREGRKIYPNDKNLVIDELNYYLKTGQTKEAIENLNIAINNDPKNALLHFSLGTLYDNMANPTEGTIKQEDYVKYIDLAKSSYEKAIEADGNYFDAYYNLGALFFNQGVAKNNEANNVPPKETAKYDKLKKEATDIFTKALPYLEKAHQLAPDDKNTMLSLKQLYANTNNKEKYNEIRAKLGQ